jgi:hypothetical protein
MWAVFGAVLGPAALALLRLAPPGRCWSCAAPTQGWQMICVSCGEDVREPAPEVEERVRVHGPLTVIEGAASGSAPRPGDARAARLMASPRGDEPRSADARRIELVKRPANPEPAFHVPAVSASASGSADISSDPVRRLKSRLGRSDQGNTAAALAPAPEVRSFVLASAIYMTGSRGLLAGSRYGIALVGDDLQILGPVDVDPTAVVIVHSLRGLDATGLQGRLIITSGEGRRDRLALVFMSVAGASAERVADAIVAAASELGPNR